MQSSISTHRSQKFESISYLMDMVETRMIESVSANRSRISKSATGALEAAAYHLAAGGQRVRAKIALHAGLALGLSSSDAIAIAATVELMHNASLVHDDIQDRDEMRRGQKAVWYRFGINIAICTGDLLLSAAYAALCDLEKPCALSSMILLVHKRTAMAIDGQCADLTADTFPLKDSASAITRYQQIAMAKSGALLSLPIELVLLASGYEEYLADARHAAEAFSVAYQVADDLHDVQSDMCSDSAKDTLNIISVFKAAGCGDDSEDNAKKLGLDYIDLTIELAKRLPKKAGAQLIDYAYQLRDVFSEKKPEALIGEY